MDWHPADNVARSIYEKKLALSSSEKIENGLENRRNLT